jgi:2,4-dienoyl-CoA reductase-like NADH-dependent reductase (Old Yellow Enzyme family)
VLETLFSPGKIGNVQIKNRIVRSATFMRSSEKYGFVSDKLIRIYDELARGGSGLIISGFTAVDPGGTASPYQACLYDDSFIPGQKKLVEKVHEYPNVKFAAQIAHTGRQGYHPKFHPVAPSPIPFKLTGLTPREIQSKEIKDYIKKFVDAGYRAYTSGYDLVQLHAAHGYFLSNFLSPFTNRRTDSYGGSSQNRVRILIDIYDGLRDKIGKNFPIIVKLQVEDFIPNGLTLEEGVVYAKILSEIGFDAIEPSGGGGDVQTQSKKPYPSLRCKTPEEENYFLPHAVKIKPLLKNCKLILMGGIKNPIFAEKIINENIADFISMSRPLIYEPDLPNRWKRGDLSPAKCISCNGCYMTMRNGPVYCITRSKNKKKKKNRNLI